MDGRVLPPETMKHKDGKTVSLENIPTGQYYSDTIFSLGQLFNLSLINIKLASIFRIDLGQQV